MVKVVVSRSLRREAEGSLRYLLAERFKTGGGVEWPAASCRMRNIERPHRRPA